MERIETSILKGLIYDREYSASVRPFLSESIFGEADQVLYKLIHGYTEKFNDLPSREALMINLNKLTIGEDMFEECVHTLNAIESSKDERPDSKWLLEETESFVRDKSVFNAIYEAIEILDGNEKDGKTKHAIPKMLEEALAISFDSNVGHDYADDAEARYEYYTREESRIPFDLTKLNDITKGGTPGKTLNCILAGTNVGKSLCLCHFSASWLMQGKNVLYISLEMGEEEVAERIDANLMDMKTDDIRKLSKESFMTRFSKVKAKATGKLIVKQFPTAGAHVGHFRHLLNELKLKKKFIPDVICIDYINICASSRYRSMAGVNSYSLVKAIAEEVRGLAVEFQVPIWTATQTNRDGYSSAALDMTDVSESFGLAMTLDFLVGVVTTEELMERGQFLWCLLKTRYGNKQGVKNFVTGVDYDRQRLFDVDATVSEELTKIRQTQKEEDVPIMDVARGKGKKQISADGWQM